VFFLFFEKNYKAKFSTSSIYKKTDKDYLKKKKSISCKINEKKTCKKKETKAEKNTWGKLQCFKEKNKKTKFSTSLIVKK